MILAYCGLDCEKCGVFIATRDDDNAKREELAKEWSEMMKVELTAEDMNCKGCHSDLLFKHCQACDIRNCAMGKKLSFCAKCEEYACEKLDPIHQFSEEAKARLDGLAKAN